MHFWLFFAREFVGIDTIKLASKFIATDLGLMAFEFLIRDDARLTKVFFCTFVNCRACAAK